MLGLQLGRKQWQQPLAKGHRPSRRRQSHCRRCGHPIVDSTRRSAVMALPPMAASNPTSVPQGKTPSMSTRRLDSHGQRHLFCFSHPLWCRHQLVECTPRSLQRGTSATPCSNPLTNGTLPTPSVDMAFPISGKAHLLLGGTGAARAENLARIPQSRYGASARFFMWFSRKRTCVSLRTAPDLDSLTAWARTVLRPH